MNLSRAIEYLRSRSDKTKSRIAAGTVLVAALALGGIWLSGIADKLGGVSTDDLAINNRATSELSQTNRIKVEGAENKNGKTLIYIRTENTHSDILNLPKVESVYITVGNKSFEAEKLTARQDQPFPIKALSNTTIYGVVVFPEFELRGDATITFNDMFFDQDTARIFREEIEVDLSKLEPVGELRS